ncbi:MAG: hypothetical protein WC374_00340 [Phycisphaerae bacterium]|jgi:hypothetical protein
MIRLLLTGFWLAIIACQAFAVFTYQDSKEQNTRLEKFYLQPLENFSSNETGIQPDGDAAEVQDWFSQRLAGEMLGDDFLLGPVSIMRLSRSNDKLLAFGPSGFDIHRYYLSEIPTATGQSGEEKIVVSQMPSPNSLLLVIAAIASVGWLRNRATKQ